MPVVLNEPSGVHPRQFDLCVASEELSQVRLSGEVVFERAGCPAAIGDSSRSATCELEQAPAVDVDGAIGFNVREVAAELEGVLTLQYGDAVLKIVIRVRCKVLRTI